MTVYINGTTGISGVDGSAGTPAVQGTDTNTGVFYPAADTVGVSTGGSERMRVDSSGNVGIGTTAPSYKLDVRSSLAVLDGSANIGFWANGSTYTQVWQTLQSTNDFLIKTTLIIQQCFKLLVKKNSGYLFIANNFYFSKNL